MADHQLPDYEDPTTTEKSCLKTSMVLRLHADNLPRWGLRMGLPDTFAVVTSVRPETTNHGGEDGSGSLTLRSSWGNHLSYNNPQEQQQAPQTPVLRRKEWGRTETVLKSCKPQWTKTFPITYEFGTEVYFFVRVFRVASGGRPGGKVKQHEAENDNGGDDTGTTAVEGESLGDAIFEIGDILGSRNHTKIKRLPKGGIIFCRMEPMEEANQKSIFRFRLGAEDLSPSRRNGGFVVRSPFASAPDTIVQIAKRHPAANKRAWIVVYRSQPVDNSLSPTWDTGQVDLVTLCNGDWDRPLRFSVWTYRKSAQDIMIGICETTLRMILNTQRDDAVNSSGFPLQRSMDKPKQVGRLLVKMAQVMDLSNKNDSSIDHDDLSSMTSCPDTIADQPYTIDIGALPTPLAAPATFQDYMKSWNLDFTVAIDFTSSNGDPRTPGSLHDQNPITLNDYEETMVAIGNAVAPYTLEGALETSVWGFGCKFGGELRHIFQCGPDPKVRGVGGILQAYRSVFESDLTMSGPTCFDHVLQAVAVQARKNQQKGIHRYGVLLLISDGICVNMAETKRKLQVYSTVPLSVIFVGVGREEFGAMVDIVEHDSGVSRPNATFVEFRQLQDDPISLGRSALQNLPSQLVQYMLQQEIEP